MTSKVNKMKLQEKVLKWKLQGLSTREIAKKVKEITGESVSHVAVAQWMRSDKKASKTIVERRTDLQELLVRYKLNIYEQILDTNRLTKEKIDELSTSRSHVELVRYLQEVRNQQSLILKLLGELHTNNESVKVNITNVENNIQYIENNLYAIYQSLSKDKKKQLANMMLDSDKDNDYVLWNAQSSRMNDAVKKEMVRLADEDKVRLVAPELIALHRDYKKKKKKEVKA